MQTTTESPDSLDDTLDAESGFPTDGSSKRNWLGRIGMWLGSLLAIMIGAGLLILSLASVEPAFYRAATVIDPKHRQQQRRLGSEMESRILDLHNAAVSAEAWSVTFSQQQINGWLASELQRKFPQLLPSEVKDPRVSIADGRITVAFRCESPPFRGIGIIEGDVFLTQVLNQVGIRFRSVRSGAIPIPLALFTETISEYAAAAEVDIEWLNEGGDPTVIIDLPAKMLRPAGNFVELKSLEVRDETISIAGVAHLEDF